MTSLGSHWHCSHNAVSAHVAKGVGGMGGVVVIGGGGAACTEAN